MSERECCKTKTATEEVVKEQPTNPTKRPCGCYWKSDTAQLCFKSHLIFYPKDKETEGNENKEGNEGTGNKGTACGFVSGFKSKMSKVKEYTAGINFIPRNHFNTRLPECKDLLVASSVELIHILQILAFLLLMSVYYLLFTYAFVVYYTLLSIQYFIEADKPMKITISVVTATAVILCNEILKRVYVLLNMK